MLALCASLTACGAREESQLVPLVGDRIEIGALKDVRVFGEIRDPTSMHRAIEFANTQRQRTWTTFQVIHGCESVLLTVFLGTNPVGYFAWEPSGDGRGHFYTSSSSGKVRRGATESESREFISLLPQDVQLKKCK
jgi:hypothetical protein